MLVAAIYDIHGNLPALEAVLEEIRIANVDLVVVVGDVVPGPMPCESLECLQDFELPLRFIMGNTDRKVLAQARGETTDWFRTAPQPWREPVSWTAQQLGTEQQQFMASWPATDSLEIDRLGQVLFCHATPRSDTETFTRLTEESRLVPVLMD